MSVPKIPDQDDILRNVEFARTACRFTAFTLRHILRMQETCRRHHDTPGRVQPAPRCQPLDPYPSCRVDIYKPFARTDSLPPVRPNSRIRHHQPAANRLDIEIVIPRRDTRIMEGHPRYRIPGRIPNLDLATLEIRGIQEIR